jgi:uncharacterized protein (DUF983 family)
MASIRQHLIAIWNKRCPRCLEGAIYRRSMDMNARCPICDLPLEREQGYFMGALYISYALASFFLGSAACTIYLLRPDLDLGLIVLIVGVLFLPLVPAVTRYSRVIWIHFDRWAWPDQSQPPK